jgi:hypothetical protein
MLDVSVDQVVEINALDYNKTSSFLICRNKKSSDWLLGWDIEYIDNLSPSVPYT